MNKTMESWVSVGELVVKVLGHLDQATCDVITRHARRDPKGLNSIPSRYVRADRVNPGNRRQHFSYLVCPESLAFFGNLVALESFLPPRVVSAYLRRGIDARDLHAELDKAKLTVRAQAEVYVKWAMSWSDVEKRVLDQQVDPRAELLFDEQRYGTPAALSLHVARQLKDLEAAPHARKDDGAVEAAKALHLLKLGEVDLAEKIVNEVLKKEPKNPEANYAYAVMALMRAAKSDKDANYFGMMVHEVDLSQEAYFEDRLADAVCDAQRLRREALTRLAAAYLNWPFEDTGKYRYPLDNVRYLQMQRLMAELAFNFSHDHGSVDLTDFNKINRRRKGEAVDTYFGQDVDKALLEVLARWESSPPYDSSGGVFEMETRMLQLLFVLSPDGYTRYFPQWLKALRTHPTWDVEPYVAASERAIGKVIREHVRRNLSDVEREELLKFLEERSVENARDRYVRIRESMGDPKPQAEEDWDFE